MPVNQYKQGSINEEFKRVLARILPEVKDPRIPAMPTIVSVEVSGDLKYAKVYLSFLDAYDEREVRQGLKAVSGFLRHRLGEELQFRVVPELVFVLDHSLEQGMRIHSILKDLNED